MYALTGVHAGPLWLRGLNQNAVSHTCEPAATVEGNSTSKLVRVVDPSKVQAEMSAGGAAPTKLNRLAPCTPSGLPRRSLPTLRRFTLIVRPIAVTISSTGASVGGLIGEGTTSRGVSPRSIFCCAVTLAVACTMRA